MSYLIEFNGVISMVLADLPEFEYCMETFILYALIHMCY